MATRVRRKTRRSANRLKARGEASTAVGAIYSSMAYVKCSCMWLAVLMVAAISPGCSRDNPAFGSDLRVDDTDDVGASHSTSRGDDDTGGLASTTRGDADAGADADSDATSDSGVGGASTTTGGEDTVEPKPCPNGAEPECEPGQVEPCEHNNGQILCVDCQWDDSACLHATCGNGIVEPGEECDFGLMPREVTCQAAGFAGQGSVTCDDDCNWTDVTNSCCILPGDSCDYANVNGCCDATAECLADGGQLLCLFTE
jgi:hypothetical protein